MSNLTDKETIDIQNKSSTSDRTALLDYFSGRETFLTSLSHGNFTRHKWKIEDDRAYNLTTGIVVTKDILLQTETFS